MDVKRERLWKQYFDDPSQWWNNRLRKISPRSADFNHTPACPDFKHKITKESLWLDGYASPSVEEELRRRGLKESRHEEQFKPVKFESPYSIVSLLKACTTQKDLDRGSKLHAYIQENKDLETNVYIGSALVNMYAKCGALTRAHTVLEQLPVRNVAAWNSLIAGHAQQGQGEEALKCFNGMLHEGHSPSAVTFACVLKACGSIGVISKAKEIHDMIVSLGILDKDMVLGSTLVDVYTKCGALDKAQQLLKELPMRDLISWSALIAGYAKHAKGEEALKCFDDMLCEGHTPDVVTFICVLKACGSIKAVAKGKEIHDKIVSLGMLEKDTVLGSHLVDMYAKCGAVAKAQQLFEELPARDVDSWSALIAGYAEHGQGKKALQCFDDMLGEGHTPDAVTFSCVLKACGSIGAAAKGKHVHDKIVNLGMLEKDAVLGSTLVDMYAKCGALAKAKQVLEGLPVRYVVTWSALIAGYAQHGQGNEALNCFDDMLCEGHTPDGVTFICVLKACGTNGAAAKGEEIHDKIACLGMLEKDIVLGSTLVDMYVKCGELVKAEQVLKELPVRNGVTWSALIAGYAQKKQGEEAIKCFYDMLHEGHFPDAVTFNCVLKACGSIGIAAKGKEVHDKITSLGMLEKDVVLGNSLVDMYVKCGALLKAQQVLIKLPTRDVASWNALIGGYAQQGQGEEALRFFSDMLHEGHCPDVVTFVCALKACRIIGAAEIGKEIHDKIVSMGMLQTNAVLGNALVDMYVKCGALAKAQSVLEELLIWNVVSWNALIAGYAQQAQTLETINCIKKMKSKGVKPDSITLISVLIACSHSGLLEQAEAYFSGMSIQYGIHPDLEHYCCMIDLFGRAGKLNKALSVVAEMPSDNHLSNWVALLGACRKCGEVQIGRLAFEWTLHLDKHNVAAYVLMADIYTAAGMWEEADKTDVMRMAS